jgi:hypothetical protein
VKKRASGSPQYPFTPGEERKPVVLEDCIKSGEFGEIAGAVVWIVRLTKIGLLFKVDQVQTGQR